MNTKKPMIMCVVGARPNFMKIAPILRAFKDPQYGLDAMLLHTGQHYDEAMYHRLFADLAIPAPDINLNVGSGGHAAQTAEIMIRFDPAITEYAPDAVLVVGDVNSTIACALVASKRGVPVFHVEAGLRSFDWEMPEEVNRVLTDRLADLLFTTETAAEENLKREGEDPSRIHFVGNVMIDTLYYCLPSATPAGKTLREAGVTQPLFNGEPNSFGLVTMHRPSNVDDPDMLRSLLQTLGTIAQQLPLVIPLHPRTQHNVEMFGLQPLLEHPGIAVLPPQGYLSNIGLMRNARVVLTDSGAIQEETTALGVSCLTLRENTERPVTIEQGTNLLVGRDPQKILEAFEEVMQGQGKSGRIPHYWDGRSSERICQHIKEFFSSRNTGTGAV